MRTTVPCAPVQTRRRAGIGGIATPPRGPLAADVRAGRVEVTAERADRARPDFPSVARAVNGQRASASPAAMKAEKASAYVPKGPEKARIGAA
ncbi:hypothetical protein ACFXDJ_07930 [Streptomyces sp. NPDC059443]|uniref:hypothetical protein n=1 Tax=unclassified Streptomyces TaxID=2593676 RepID=UPI0036BA350A